MTKKQKEAMRRQWDEEGVRALRRRLGYTQQKLARELGVRQQTISEWETGVYQPRGASRTLLNIIAERAGFQYQVDQAEEAAAYNHRGSP